MSVIYYRQIKLEKKRHIFGMSLYQLFRVCHHSASNFGQRCLVLRIFDESQGSMPFSGTLERGFILSQIAFKIQ